MAEKFAGKSDSEFYCDICIDDTTVEADAYCTVCSQYLCQSCTTVHARVKMTKSHKLLIGDAMYGAASFYDRSLESSSAPEEKSKCLQHLEEDIDFFCQAHDTPCCAKCKLLDHRSCSVDNISDIARKPEVDQANRTTLKNAKNILDEVNDAMQANARDREQLAGKKSKIVDSLKSQRKKIDAVVDQWEKSVLDMVEKSFEYQTKQIDEHSKLFTEVASATKDKVTKLDIAIKSSEEETIVTASETRKDIKKYTNTLSEIRKEKVEVKVELRTREPSRKLTECLEDSSRLVVVKSTPGQTPTLVFPKVSATENRTYRNRAAVEDGDINVENPSDTQVPGISGIEVLQDGRTIMCDINNSKLKLYDKNYNFLHEITLSSEPWRICRTRNFAEIVVTLPDEHSIQFVNVGSAGQMTLGRKIKLDVKGNPHIVPYGDAFIVRQQKTRDALLFHIVDRNGKRVESIPVKNVPKSFCDGKFSHAAMDVSGTILYFGNNVGGCLGLSVSSGEVVFHFKETRGDCDFGYSGVTTDPDGNVYVGEAVTGDIIQVDKNGQKICALITGVHDVRFINFVSSRNTMFVKQRGVGFVKMYRLQ